MKVQKPVVVEKPLAEQVADAIGIPAENLCVVTHPNGDIEVARGRVVGGQWVATGDIPATKRAAVTAWAQAQQAKKG